MAFNKSQFAKLMTEKIRDYLANEYKINNFSLAKGLACIALLESGWGASKSGNYNYYGIKDNDGASVTTHELINGVRQKVKRGFKNFKTFDDGVKSFVDLLINHYKVHEIPTITPDSLARNLKKSNYYTDTYDNYVNRLSGIMNGPTYHRSISNVSETPQQDLNKNMDILSKVQPEVPDALDVNY
jgi:flagellum-specific peptidoglycan hydrolase FlgJ